MSRAWKDACTELSKRLPEFRLESENEFGCRVADRNIQCVFDGNQICVSITLPESTFSVSGNVAIAHSDNCDSIVARTLAKIEEIGIANGFARGSTEHKLRGPTDEAKRRAAEVFPALRTG